MSLLMLMVVHGQRRMNFNKMALKLGRETNTEKVRQLLTALRAEGERREHSDKVILSHLFLGELEKRTGNFAEAEKSLLQAYRLYQMSFNTRKHNYLISTRTQYTYFDAIDQLAHFYLYTGNLKKAEQLFLESKTVRDASLLKLSAHRIHPVIGLGSVYLRQGKQEKAFEQFEQARDMISRATTTRFDFDMLNRLYYADMIELCFQQNKLKEARRYIELLSIASSGVIKFSSRLILKLETARVFELYARLFMAEGDYRKAQEYLDKANTYYPVSAYTSGVKFKISKTQAVLYWQQQDWEHADAAFLDMVRLYRTHIVQNFIAMSEYEKEQFYATLKSDFDLFNSYVAQSFTRNPTTLLVEMYNNVISTKALLLNASNQKKNKILASDNAGLISKLHEWEKSKALLSALYFEKGSEQQIVETTRTIEQLEKDLNQQSGLFDTKENPVDWQKIQNTLMPDEAAVELVRISVAGTIPDSSAYIMLVIKPGEANPSGYMIPAGSRVEKRNLAFYRNSIMAKTEDNLSYDVFWRPLKNRLPGINKIYLSPDGVYNQINLNTLFNKNTGQYLIDETELIYLTNTADLLVANRTNETQRAVLVGRPHFDEAVDYGVLASGYGQRNVLSEELLSFKDQDFIDLPGTEAELTIIHATLRSQGVSVTSYVGPEAIEQNVKAVKSPSVFHVATHGFFVDDSASLVSPMIRSGLVLAGVKNKTKTGGEDGILTAYEATNLDLQNTSLVVLSACQTGLGEVRNGEGVYGLQRAIIVAGARNLLMSLWKVDDAATADLMSAFYQARPSSSNLTAFHQAQVELRKKYPQPYYWGAFIMLGK
jgi:CHAT domain-containing protein/tetratricopeptide (TPR) repeat protein